VLPVAGIENARFGERTRARAVNARRAVRGSLCLSTLVVAVAVGIVQAESLFVIHSLVPGAAVAAAVVIVLAALACLWVGTFAFVRLVTRRGGWCAATVTTLAFYGLALPLGTDDTVATMIGLLPAALIAAPAIIRFPWPAEPARPTLNAPEP